MSAKGKYIVFLTIAIMAVSACSSGSKDSSEQSNSTTPISLSELPEFDGELDFTYVPETDAQSELGEYPGRAYTGDGIYTLKQTDESSSVSGTFLTFFDYASGQTVYVCGKSDCTHTDDSCNAFFSISEYIPPCIWYYDGSLYINKTNKDYVGIERVSLDGSVREESCTLMRVDQTTTTEEDGSVSIQTHYPKVTLHRGYAYFLPGNPEGVNQLYRVKLDSGEETELLYSMEGIEYPTLYRLKPYGRYVFFQMGSLDNNNPEELDIALYAYDTVSGEISFAAENVFRPYAVGGKYLYYTGWENEVYQKNLETGEVTLFYEHMPDEDIEYNVGPQVFGIGNSVVYECNFMDKNGESGWEEFDQQFVLDENGEITDTFDTEHNNLVTPYGPKIPY